MRLFLLKSGKFALLFAGILLLLLFIDLFVYDYNPNSYLNDRDRLENKIVVIGSSSIFFGLIDDTLKKHVPLNVYASGGQYGMETLTFIYNKYRRKEIGHGNVFIVELDPADEIATGFHNYYYFAENFLLSGLEPFKYYTPVEWSKIILRIYRDITSFGINKTKPFKWASIESVGLRKAPFNRARYMQHCTNETAAVPASVFNSNIKNIAAFLSKVEAETGSVFYILLPPGWQNENGMAQFSGYFSPNRIIDLSCMNGRLEDPACWHDGTHLTAKGARIFTDSLSKLVTKIYTLDKR